MAPRAEFVRQQGPMAVASVPRAVYDSRLLKLVFPSVRTRAGILRRRLRELLPLARSRANSALTFSPRQ
jgi:hypothetical protein